MRIEQTVKPFTHEYCTQALGNDYGCYYNTRNVLYAYSKRPDVRKNPKDSTGFRRPSPYSGEFLTYNPASVRAVYGKPNTPTWDYRHHVNEAGWSFSEIFGDPLAGFLDWENSLKQQALRSVKDQRVNLSMSLAFLPQTLKMVRGNFSTINNVLLSARRGDWRNVGKLLKVDMKSTADFYLLVLFGWLQLMRDTQGIVEELHRECNKPHRTFVYGRAKRSQDVPPVTIVREPSGGWGIPARLTYFGDRKVDHSLVMIYRGETALLSRMSQLGLTNPLELLWDLVPWSWVVNMGVSIGDFISTLDATIGLTYLGGTYTRYSRVAGTITPEPVYGKNWWAYNFDGKPGFYEQVKFDRKVIDEHVDPFVLKNPFGAPIAMTAAVIAAVVQQGRKGAPQPPRGRTRNLFR